MALLWPGRLVGCWWVTLLRTRRLIRCGRITPLRLLIWRVGHLACQITSTIHTKGRLISIESSTVWTAHMLSPCSLFLAEKRLLHYTQRAPRKTIKSRSLLCYLNRFCHVYTQRGKNRLIHLRLYIREGVFK